MKRCQVCGDTKPLDAFSINRRASDGRQGRCKPCAAQKQREYYAATIEDRRAYNNARRQNPEFREAMRLYLKDYYRANPDKWDEAKWNPEKVQRRREVQRQRLRSNDVARFRKNQVDERRRAMKMSLPVSRFTESDWAGILRRQRRCCFYCGIDVAELTMDHLIPFARGGSHSVGNIVAACRSCNSRKGKKTRAEFMLWLRRRQAAA